MKLAWVGKSLHGEKKSLAHWIACATPFRSRRRPAFIGNTYYCPSLYRRKPIHAYHVHRLMLEGNRLASNTSLTSCFSVTFSRSPAVLVSLCHRSPQLPSRAVNRNFEKRWYLLNLHSVPSRLVDLSGTEPRKCFAIHRQSEVLKRCQVPPLLLTAWSG